MANITDSIKTVLPASNKDVVIEDPVLEPYFIVNYVEGGWGVCMKRLSGKGELKYRDICYPNSFTKCLEAVVGAKMQSSGGFYDSLQAYLDDWRQLSEKITNSISI